MKKSQCTYGACTVRGTPGNTARPKFVGNLTKLRHYDASLYDPSIFKQSILSHRMYYVLRYNCLSDILDSISTTVAVDGM